MTFAEKAKIAYVIGGLVFLILFLGGARRLKLAYLHIQRTVATDRTRLMFRLWACFLGSLLPTVVAMYLIQLRFPRPSEVDWIQWSLVALSFCLQPISLRAFLKWSHLSPFA